MTANDHSETSPVRGAGWIDAGGLLGDKIRLVFTDRRGGVSSPPYDSLNLAYHTGDEPRNVFDNRMRVAAKMCVAAERFIYLQQVHGVRVARTTLGDLKGSENGLDAVIAETDGVFTTEKGVVLSVLTADCVPIALALPSAGVVAMLHAGWRGTIGNIVASALDGIKRETGLDPGEIKAVMGPAIGPCCYEVDEGRARLFVEKYGEESNVVTGEGRRRPDLFRANLINLLEAGVRHGNISRVGGCTCCEGRYFSFRRDGVTGRQGAFVYRVDEECENGSG
ncbi:MAG: peptidoglycan editing factor PgeF [Actinobacteria bacterium]|nr:peptidoglycan editing factor PgeF [Actinomycetota bacterium]